MAHGGAVSGLVRSIRGRIEKAVWRTRLHAAAIGLVALGAMSGSDHDAQKTAAISPRTLVAGWSMQRVSEMPDPIGAIASTPIGQSDVLNRVFVGTAPRGSVFCLDPQIPAAIATVASGMGDHIQYGVCDVVCMAVADLDGDGQSELHAVTSQIFPVGRPRFYGWRLDSATSVPLGVARPAIRSQWSHGLALIERPGEPGRAFVTYCGHGEVVEFRMSRTSTASGFTTEGIDWKKVGQLPASGEWTQAADADNDGAVEVCVATGYGKGAAAIRIYDPGAVGTELVLKREIDEGKRFANVRFVVGSIAADRAQELVAWWCTDHVYGGNCEVIRYRLSASGVQSRRVVTRGAAAALWPSDGQFAVGDLDGNGQNEVWFATHSGELWRYDESESELPRRICSIDGGIGPIAVGRVTNAPRPTLFLGSGRRLLRLDWNGVLADAR
jgi:hypothetical protein